MLYNPASGSVAMLRVTGQCLNGAMQPCCRAFGCQIAEVQSVLQLPLPILNVSHTVCDFPMGWHAQAQSWQWQQPCLFVSWNSTTMEQGMLQSAASRLKPSSSTCRCCCVVWYEPPHKGIVDVTRQHHRIVGTAIKNGEDLQVVTAQHSHRYKPLSFSLTVRSMATATMHHAKCT